MRAGWSSRAGLVWAAAGSAVGFGNLLKFPAALERGGGAFLLLYLLIVCLMGMPLLCLEFWAGRRAGGGPPAVMGRLAVFPLLACVFSLAYYLRLGGLDGEPSGALRRPDAALPGGGAALRGADAGRQKARRTRH